MALLELRSGHQALLGILFPGGSWILKAATLSLVYLQEGRSGKGCHRYVNGALVVGANAGSWG